MKRIISLAVAFSLFTCTAACDDMYNNEGYSRPEPVTEPEYEESGIIDEKGLFTSADIEMLNDVISDCADSLDVNIMVYVAGTKRSDDDTEKFTDEKCIEAFGADSDSIMLYLDASGIRTAYDYISMNGNIADILSFSTDDIFDDIYNYLPASGEAIKEENYIDAIEAFCDSVNYHYLVNTGEIEETTTTTTITTTTTTAKTAPPKTTARSTDNDKTKEIEKALEKTDEGTPVAFFSSGKKCR